eukprot:GHVQ01023138.1.p1 GENE.GHVQ01023138.1~~GHVQ01023138.1.p1  ORF type:complete len:394 (+),score=71.55 GHVQ01023138.1:2111-3292(+)
MAAFSPSPTVPCTLHYLSANDKPSISARYLTSKELESRILRSHDTIPSPWKGPNVIHNSSPPLKECQEVTAQHPTTPSPLPSSPYPASPSLLCADSPPAGPSRSPQSFVVDGIPTPFTEVSPNLTWYGGRDNITCTVVGMNLGDVLTLDCGCWFRVVRGCVSLLGHIFYPSTFDYQLVYVPPWGPALCMAAVSLETVVGGGGGSDASGGTQAPECGREEGTSRGTAVNMGRGTEGRRRRYESLLQGTDREGSRDGTLLRHPCDGRNEEILTDSSRINCSGGEITGSTKKSPDVDSSISGFERTVESVLSNAGDDIEAFSDMYQVARHQGWVGKKGNPCLYRLFAVDSANMTKNAYNSCEIHDDIQSAEEKRDVSEERRQTSLVILSAGEFFST